jgi:hypothetical protein
VAEALAQVEEKKESVIQATLKHESVSCSEECRNNRAKIKEIKISILKEEKIILLLRRNKILLQSSGSSK